MNSPEYKRKKRRNWQRNKRRKERLIAQGFTPERAQEIIDATGTAVEELHIARARADAAELQSLRDAERKRYPVQPSEPQSVRDIPTGAFETNRRRH
jgi:hypothetical protein